MKFERHPVCWPCFAAHVSLTFIKNFFRFSAEETCVMCKNNLKMEDHS